MADRFGIFRLPPAALAALPAALAVVWSSSAACQPRSGPGLERLASTPYIDCPAGETAATRCTVDLVTYIGWRVFEEYCASCHGPDAEGSTFAPSLVHRMQRFDRQAFDRVLDEGYAGPFAPMPPWGEHPQVARYYDELWAYLSARARGDLPPAPLDPLRERPADGPAE